MHLNLWWESKHGFDADQRPCLICLPPFFALCNGCCSSWQMSVFWGSKSSPSDPRWVMVDVQFVRMMKRYIPLAELKAIHLEHKNSGGPLKNLALFTKARLSVQPLTQGNERPLVDKWDIRNEWLFIVAILQWKGSCQPWHCLEERHVSRPGCLIQWHFSEFYICFFVQLNNGQQNESQEHDIWKWFLANVLLS